jgi:hypothetical protein
MSEASKAKFKEILAKHYAVLFESDDPDYNNTWLKSKHTPQSLADKMTESLCVGLANREGKGIKRACKELDIKYTYTAIKEYLNGE